MRASTHPFTCIHTCIINTDLSTCRLVDLSTCGYISHLSVLPKLICRLVDLSTCRPVDLLTCRLVDLSTCRSSAIFCNKDPVRVRVSVWLGLGLG